MCVYRIKDWDLHFEKSQTRKAKTHHWVAMPIKHDGVGYRRITIQPNAAELFCAWCLIVQVAAKCPVRGVLADEDGRGFDSEDLAIKTGFPVSIFDTALDFFTQKKVSWLTTSKTDSATSKNETSGSATSETKKTTSKTQNTTSGETHSTVQYSTRQNRHNPCTEKASSVPESGDVLESENPAIVPAHGKNILILHRPEEAQKVKLETYADFCKADVTSIACTLSDEFPDKSGKCGPGMGWFSKQLKALADRKGDGKACELFREELFRYAAEVRQGEAPMIAGAAIISRVRRIMENNGGVAS